MVTTDTNDKPSLFVPGKAGMNPSKKLPKAFRYGGVVYIDGGARPNPGNAGWGLHGYIYANEEPKKGSGCKKAVPTTKGYVPKDKVKEKPITIIKYFDGAGPIVNSTNQVAELNGAINAFKTFIEVAAEYGDEFSRLNILADSKYVIDGSEQWIIGWKANGWVKNDGGPISNLTQWKELDTLMDTLRGMGVDIIWNWVKGHSGELGNSIADYLASCGVTRTRKRIKDGFLTVTNADGYWTPDNDYNRLINHSKWYFNTNVGGALKSADGRFTYHLGNHGKDDDLLGKRISDARFSVLFLKEAVPALEMMRDYQDETTDHGVQNIVIGRLDQILKADNHRELTRHGTAHVDIYGPRRDLGLPLNAEGPGEDEKSEPKYYTQLTRVCSPARLAANAVGILTVLENILETYVANPESDEYTVTDITALLYETEATKKGPVSKLKKHVDSAMKSFEAQVSYNTGAGVNSTPLIITLDIDIPDRNTLSAIAPKNPIVRIITWKESPTAFRYAVIVQTEDDIGIWAGVYSNLKVLL